LFGDLDNFRSVSLHLDRSLTVIRIDLPGHGKSPSLASLSIESMADAVSAELSALGIRHYHLLGHSLGGKVAMAMASGKNSRGLERLCVVDIAPKQYDPHHQPIIDALLTIDLNNLGDRREADGLLKASIPDAGVRAFLLKSLYKHESGRFRWRFDLKQLANNYSLLSQPPSMPNNVVGKTLFIKGGKSDYLVPSDETVIKTHFKQPSLHIIEGAGHWPHAEKPAQFSRAVTEFFSSN